MTMRSEGKSSARRGTIRSRSCLRSLAAALLVATSPAALAATPSAATPSASVIARGKYLVTMGDCAACHTAAHGQPFAGGYRLDTPFGPMFTPNITPDKATGIGWMTEADFYKVMHDGIGYHGEYLYPSMPFPWFTHVTRADDDAIFAYLKSLKPVHAPKKPSHLAFPFNIRAGLVAWRAAFFHPGPFKPNPNASAAVNRGAYLVQGLGHCGACHNSNELLGNTKLAGRLQGGSIDGWYAPDLTANMHQGTGSWTVPQLVDFLQHGHAPDQGVVLGPMAMVVHDSLSKVSRQDVHDIALYLKSLPAKASISSAPPPTALAGAHPDGGNLFISHCSSCHGLNGEGMKGKIPALAGNGAVVAGGPQNVIDVVLHGLPAQGPYAPMPAVGVSLSDAQIAAITNYVRTAWGNNARPSAGPGDVGKARDAASNLSMLSDPNTHCTPIENASLSSALAPGSAAQQALGAINGGNFLSQISTAIKDTRQAAPDVKPADLVNGITAAFCPRVAAAHLTRAEAAQRLGNFSMLVWGQLNQKGGHD